MTEKNKKMSPKYVMGAHQLLVFQEYLATIDEEDIKKVGIDLFTLNATFLCLSPIRYDVGGFDN